MIRIVKLYIILFFLAALSGCAFFRAPKPPLIMLSGVEWQSQAPGGQLQWKEFKRTGAVRRSPDTASEGYRDYLSFDEQKLSEAEIAELWKTAEQVVINNEKIWQDPVSSLGEGYQQVTINFCHYRLGWETLSVALPINAPANDKNLQKLLNIIQDQKPH